MLHYGILGVHSLLRWVLLGLLIINIIRINIESKAKYDETDQRFSFWITLFAWLNLVAALDLYFFGPNGLLIMKEQGYSLRDVFNSSWLRFWIIEHPCVMMVALILMIASHRISKRNIGALQKLTTMNVLYIMALFLIVIAIPWPFRVEGIARPSFRGLY